MSSFALLLLLLLLSALLCLFSFLILPFQFFKDQMSSVLPFTDIVFGNETEAAAYAESFGLDTTDVGEIAMKIAQLPKVVK